MQNKPNDINILVSNDDGIQAKGIRRLVKALSACGKVYVFAPDGQRSASSHALNISSPVTLKRVEFENAAEAWAVSGTPADCVKMGLDCLRRRGIEPDIIYAGINHGSNLGTDCMYSGTVSAAAEGAFVGKPAVAVSVNAREPMYFDGACSLAAEVLEHALTTAGSRSVININTPDMPAEEIKGVMAAYLGKIDYDEWFRVIDEKDGEITFEYTGQIEDSDEWTEETDVLLIRKGFATISMIRYDLNDYDGTKNMKDWGIELR